MAMSADDFYKHALASADSEGRLSLSRMTEWDISPFDADGLRVARLRPPVLPEHVWFFARPEGQAQLHGSWLVVWDDLLPVYPAKLAEADAGVVAGALVGSYGGTRPVR